MEFVRVISPHYVPACSSRGAELLCDLSVPLSAHVSRPVAPRKLSTCIRLGHLRLARTPRLRRPTRDRARARSRARHRRPGHSGAAVSQPASQSVNTICKKCITHREIPNLRVAMFSQPGQSLALPRWALPAQTSKLGLFGGSAFRSRCWPLGLGLGLGFATRLGLGLAAALGPALLERPQLLILVL